MRALLQVASVLALAGTMIACGGDDESNHPASAGGGTSAGGGAGTGGTTGGTGGIGAGGASTGGSAGSDAGAQGGSAGAPPCTDSGPIVLSDGPTALENLCITSPDKGIEGGNATSVTTLSLTNVTIDSVNYGIYLGDCESANFDHVDVTTSPSGGDSYSVRGYIHGLTSQSSTYRANVKAFRIYGLTSGSSTNDRFEGGRLMLGGGSSDEWVNPLPFQNFSFSGGSIAVDSIEIYDNTDHVSFSSVDFAGTAHISIQAGAHDLSFSQSKNLPEIRFYGPSGQYTPDANELAQRNIVISP